MRISGIEKIVSEVSRVFCDHSIRIDAAAEAFQSDFRPRGNARQAIVDLRYGAPVSVDAGNFDGLYLICRATRGVARIEQNGQVVHMTPGQTIVMSAGRRTKLSLGGSFSQQSVRLHASLVTKRCEAIFQRPVLKAPQFDFAVMDEKRSSQWALMLQLIDQAPDGETHLSQMRGKILEDFLLGWLMTSLPHELANGVETDRHSPEPAIVKRAERIMREHIDTPLTIVDLAEKTGVSLRTLQTAFKVWRSNTPSAIMREMRLEVAHDTLKTAPDASVAEVALRAGFTHFGRFSESYRRKFGETPGATARRLRGAKLY
jgi:AraC-like DNA-binding protein